jgi:hypothetical protein
LGDATQTIPYKVGGHLAVGEQLLALLNKYPDEAISDRDLIHGWAAELGHEHYDGLDSDEWQTNSADGGQH